MKERQDLKLRTKQFSLRVIKLVQSLPNDKVSDVLGKQLIRSGTSVGANYRSACRAKSQADFINKIHICEEEADESSYWMELLAESELMPLNRLENLMKESNELTAIFSASVLTAKQNKK
ncbi:MAG: four helix bundle protein [Spirosomaceae bacterium]|nr:four helix bundle protein [Spirosomataceae bacterium]